MSYPFFPPTKWKALAAQLEADHGIKLKTIDDCELKKPDGDSCLMHYLDGPGGVTLAVDLDDEDFVSPHIVRQICARFKIDPAEVGLELG